MPQTERRHERLADRLTQIIRRLFAGENLNMRHLAEEFGVSVRTLRRDLRERLTGLDLEYNDGHCRLVTADSAGQRERSGLTLARQSDMEALFPGWIFVWQVRCWMKLNIAPAASGPRWH